MKKEFRQAHLEWKYKDLFTITGPEGKPQKQVVLLEDWALKREQIKDTLLSVFGSFPTKRCPLNPMVIDEKQIGDVIFRTLEYNVEEDDRIRSYLTFSADLKPYEKIPVVLALHGTNNGQGGESCFNLTGYPDMESARILPSKGFAVLAPDGITSGAHVYPGEKQLDTVPFYKKHPDWSIMGKLIYDAMRSIDYIETLEFVDIDRIGVLGHSLGGYWTMFTTVFDERICAAVSSCGFVPFRTDNAAVVGNLPCRWARYEGYNHAPKMARYWEENIQPPFDFHDVMAAIAPRPFLNVSGWKDMCWQDASGIPEVCKLVGDVYRFHGVPEHFENHMFNGPHDYFEAAKIYGWIEYWLKNVKLK